MEQPLRIPASKDRAMLYAMQAEICRALGHARRIQILDLLAEGERPVSELLQALRVSKVNLSQHLAVMKHAGLVESRQHGREVSYRLAFPEIKDACCAVRKVLAQQLKEDTRLAKTLNTRDSGRPAQKAEEA